MEVIENLNEIEDEGEIYDNIEDLWPDYPPRMTFSSTRMNTKKSGVFTPLFLCPKSCF
jgi:hypothetical protein